VTTHGRAVAVATALATLSLLESRHARAQQAEAAADVAVADAASGEGILAASVEAFLQRWPPRPRLTAYKMVRKYGPPQEAAPSRLVWYASAPWKRIVVMRDEVRHDFPRPHLDHLVQTLDYRVPARKVDDLAAFDGSLLVDRTAGELAASCDSEEMNVLTLNLAHDIVIGRRKVADARELLVETERAFALGEAPKSMAALQFVPATGQGGDPDRPAEGWPRASASSADARRETLGLLVALAESQIDETREAARDAQDVEVRTLARTIQAGSQQARSATLELGQRLELAPLEGSEAEALRAESISSLAVVLRSEVDVYGGAYVSHLVRSEVRALDVLDERLRAEQDPTLRKHLALIRELVAAQLNRALALRRAGES
jgi:hypothetical protein